MPVLSFEPKSYSSQPMSRTRRSSEPTNFASVMTCIFTGLMCLMMFVWEVRYQSLKMEMQKAQQELQKTINQMNGR